MFVLLELINNKPEDKEEQNEKEQNKRKFLDINE